MRGNLATDAYPYFAYGHGIYLDQAASDILVQGNLCYHTEGATLYEHYGHRNNVTNNIIALATGGRGQVWQHANGMAPHHTGRESSAQNVIQGGEEVVSRCMVKRFLRSTN